MRKVLVIGSSGAGKSTLARELAQKARLRHVELDALYHGPSWVPRPTFVADVDEATRGDGWVADGNYPDVLELLWSRADTIVWLDFPRWLVEWQVVRRSFVRWLRDEELWNGNREEGLRAWFRPDHPVRWSFENHLPRRRLYAARFADPRWAALAKIRLRSRAEVRAFVRAQER